MVDLPIALVASFDTVAEKFRLRVVLLDASGVLALCRDVYALWVSCDLEGSHSHIECGDETRTRSYRLTNFLSTQRLETSDRRLYGNSVHAKDRRVGSLRVLASGLANRCADILSGDEAWLMALRKKDSALWSGDVPPARVLRHCRRSSFDSMARR